MQQTKQQQLYDYLKTHAVGKPNSKTIEQVLEGVGVIADHTQPIVWNRGIDGWVSEFFSMIIIYGIDISTDYQGRYFYNPKRPDLN